jgi:hypothetical protein
MDALRRDARLRDTQPEARSARTFAWCQKAMDRFKGRRAKRMIRAQRFCSDRRTGRDVAAEARSFVPLAVRGQAAAIELFPYLPTPTASASVEASIINPSVSRSQKMDWDFMFSS